jgi:hypothetical protein
MGDRWLGPDDVVAFVDAAEKDVAEVNRPDAVVDLLEPDGVLLQGIREEEEPCLEADGAGIGDALDEEVSGIFDGRQESGVRARRGGIARGRWVVVQGLVGALVVVEAAEGVEGALLGREGGARRADGLALEGFVHPFVGAVLLGLSGQDPLVLNAEAQPPDIELREAVNAGGREGDAIVGGIARGRPYSRNRWSKTGRTPWPFVESRP